MKQTIEIFKNIPNLILLRKRYDQIDSIFFVYNVKMLKNQRHMSFTGTEIRVKQ